VFHNIKDAIIRLMGKPFVDRFLDNDVSCVRPVCNHIYESLNRKPVYEENVSYGEKVELPSEKQYVQPQPLVSTNVPMEEYPPQAQLITITTEINNNGDSFEENNKVEDDKIYIYIYIYIYIWSNFYGRRRKGKVMS
jgi:hypothetical protein